MCTILCNHCFLNNCQLMAVNMLYLDMFIVVNYVISAPYNIKGGIIIIMSYLLVIIIKLIVIKL